MAQETNYIARFKDTIARLKDMWFNLLIIFCLIGASILSILGTARGFTVLLGGTLSSLETALPFDPVWFVMVATTVVAVFVQALLIEFWGRFFQPKYGVFTRFVYLLCAIVASFFSGLMAVALWLFAYGVVESFARVETYERADAMIEAGKDFEVRQNEFEQMSRLISKTASQKREEEKSGRSCDGPAVKDGEGPRWRLRDGMTTEASGFANIAEELAVSARTAIDLPTVPIDADLKDMLSNLRNLSSDPRIREMKAWYDERISAFESGTHRDVKTRQDFECFDAAVLATLKDARKSLEATMQLPNLAPRAARADQNLALQISFGLVLQHLRHGIGFADPISAEEWDLISPAVYTALAIEVVIVILTLLLELQNPRSPTPIQRPAGHKLDEEQLQSLLKSREIWQKYCHPVPGLRRNFLGYSRPTVKYIFLVPINGDSEQRNIADAEVARWNMKPKPHCLPKNLTELSVLQLNESSDVLMGASAFRGYSVPKSAIKWWRQALVDINDHLYSTGGGNVISADFQRQKSG